MADFPTIQVEAVWRSARRLADGGVSVNAVTSKQISTEDFAEMDRVSNRVGWLLFAPNALDIADIPKGPAHTRDLRSPSERLRGVMWLVHKQEDGSDATFPAYYEGEMERLIQFYKEQLPPRDGKR